MALLDTRKADIDRAIAKYPPDQKRSAVMPLLYIAQEEYGYVTSEAMQEIADILGISVTHVQGIVGFYTMFYEKPKGRYLIQICTDLPCALRGAEEFSQYVCDLLGIQPGETTPDGLFTVENVMCIAACDKAPVAQVNFHYHEHLDIEKFNKLLEALRREAEVSQPYGS